MPLQPFLIFHMSEVEWWVEFYKPALTRIWMQQTLQTRTPFAYENMRRRGVTPGCAKGAALSCGNSKYSSYTTQLYGQCQLSVDFYYSVNVMARWGRRLGCNGRDGMVDRSFRSPALSTQTETLCLGSALWLSGWGSLSTGDGGHPVQQQARLILPLPARRKSHHQLPHIKWRFLLQLTSEGSHSPTTWTFGACAQTRTVIDIKVIDSK